MNINRNNYEAYFLLYVDKELSASERNMVEVFISENPDLQEELQMLQQTIVQPDPVIFSGKEGLLRPEPVDAETGEKLLLLLDNELPVKDKEQLLSLTKNNKAVEEVWRLLQQTKLSPADSIIFEDKASLYRKEERRVVSIRWWQLAAAAMLISFGLWGTVSYLNRDSHTTIPAATATTKGKTTPTDAIPAPATTVKDSLQPTAETNKGTVAVSAATAIKQNSTVPVKKPTALAPGDAKQPEIPKEGNHNIDLVQQQNNQSNVPTPGLQHINNGVSNIPATAIVTPETNTIESPETTATPANNYAVNTVAGGSDENSFSFDDEGEDKPKRSKLGGFFKRVKRTFERKTKIKTGSSDDVKIANMSFAMH